MATARKRATEVEFYRTVERADGTLPGEWRELAEFTNYLVRADSNHLYVFDRLHNTWVQFKPGDIIIKGIQGEFYPIVPDIFEETYEVIDNVR